MGSTENSTDNAIKRLLLLQAMSALGPAVELGFHIDAGQFERDLQAFQGDWKPYNPRKNIARQGLSLTSLDGGLGGIPDLDSLMEYNG
ncbi:MAG: hypothetical protein KF865_00555 [Bdellovibrionaceae bacterium]|nr:hypothetical protein [Pseudobdellovibrionaceae bacterium]